MGTLKQDLTGPDVELRETHISWVFLSDGDVWKVKKPVDMGFLDFRTAEQRRAACEAEVRLNRRLAPDVYRGVVPITRGGDGRHRIDGDGEVVDWAVHMRRLPDRIRADVMLAEGRLRPEHLRRVAERVAAFHAEQPGGDAIAAMGRPEAIAANVQENFEQTRETVRQHLSDEEAREIERWQTHVLETQAARFEARVRQGRVRDGHGDLRLEHVYLDGDGSVTIVDCIEFNERFRYADVCADVAFLSMDLAYEGRVDLAEHFLAAYAREAGDYDLYGLVDFYESYRAYVRAKVSSILAADEEADAATRERAGGRARRYYLLALAAERRPLMEPAVVAVGGLIASGKSTVADRLSLVLGAPVICADRTRKELWGVRPTERVGSAAFEGAYSAEFTEKVYAELLRRAEVVVASGRPVLLDASFRSRAHRAAARALARAQGVPFRFVECRVAPVVAKERLRGRVEGEVSDARLELFDDFVAAWEPVDELPGREHVAIDTARPLDDNLARLRERLPAWPEGLVG
ncbi:MAG: AAA family ATPase [Myxococcota bacterium]